MKTFAWALSSLVVVLVVACGSDGKKTTRSCSADADCGGGVCFEQACYDACTETNQCADDELCVRKDRAGAEVDLCVVAADFAGCTPDAEDACADVVAGPCEAVACLDAACVVQALPDGTACQKADGATDVCASGACGQPVPCDSPVGTWSTTFTRSSDTQAACVVDGQVTQTVTFVIAEPEPGHYVATATTTNNPDMPDCGTYSADFDLGGVYDVTTRTFIIERSSPAKCNGQEMTYTTTYGFKGVLAADCQSIEGTGWIDPSDPCDPASGRLDQGTMPLTKQAD